MRDVASDDHVGGEGYHDDEASPTRRIAVGSRYWHCPMGYKRIESAIHDLAHSFMRLMKFVDHHYIVDLLPKLVREREMSDVPP